MTENLIEILKNAVSDKAIETIGKQVGIDNATVKSGMGTIIPTILAGLLGKNTTTSAAPTWLNAVGGLFNEKDEKIDADRFDFTELLTKGRGLLGGLFGDNADMVTGAIANTTGIPKEKANGLLATVSPLILGFLTKWMKGKGWSFGDLIGNLIENKSSLAAALPAGLSASNLFNFTAPKVSIDAPKVETPKPNKPKYEEPKTNNSWLMWLLGLLLLALLLWLFLGKGLKSCQTEKVIPAIDSTTMAIGDTAATAVENTAAVVKGKLNEAGDWVTDLGENLKLKLADGKELNVGENSVENRLVKFVEDANKPVDKTTWFSFDRLYFETGKSTLKPESQEQLKNIAAILKAYPKLNLKLGGYTDNTGSEATNRKISTDRANAAKDALVKLGVDAKRLEAEGYGPQHPIADNSTAEGRAQNRRIDVRVTAK